MKEVYSINLSCHLTFHIFWFWKNYKCCLKFLKCYSHHKNCNLLYTSWFTPYLRGLKNEVSPSRLLFYPITNWTSLWYISIWISGMTSYHCSHYLYLDYCPRLCCSYHNVSVVVPSGLPQVCISLGNLQRILNPLFNLWE